MSVHSSAMKKNILRMQAEVCEQNSCLQFPRFMNIELRKVTANGLD